MAAIKLLNAVAVTGEGLAHTLPHLVIIHTVQVTTTGSPTNVVLDLEGSIDGIVFEQLGTITFTTGTGMFHVTDKPVTFVQGDLKTLTGGSSPTVTMFYEGDSITSSRIGRRGQF